MRLDADRDRESTRAHDARTLPAEITGELVHHAATAFGCPLDTLLLAAFAQAAAGLGTDGPVLVDVERHGREEFEPGQDLARTVGWFTTTFPVRLDVRGAGLDELLDRVRAALDRVPRNGIGHGLLRYLNPQTAPVLAAGTRPLLGFNYLGRFDTAGDRDWAPLPGAGVLGLSLIHI